MSDLGPAKLREQRDNVSVLKVDLARLREKEQCKVVIVVEGKDDLPVYETWIKRIDADFDWEPLVAKGKRRLLEFRQLLARDGTGLSACTFFIVDYDYDGLRGKSLQSDIYLLPSYSLENYLSSESVLDSYLRAELRVIGSPELREAIIKSFQAVREIFFERVLPACIMLFAARNEACGNIKVAELGRVLAMGKDGPEVDGRSWEEGLVSTEKPLSDAGLKAAEKFFLNCELKFWVRGKFLFSFFKQFCGLIYDDRVSESPLFFDQMSTDKSLSTAGFDIRSLASRSDLPSGLAEKLTEWKERCRRECILSDG